MAALACGSGCARPDWIEQTLVTVDVTGTWQGSAGGGPGQGNASYELFLEQGPKVKGSVQRYGWQTVAGAIEGTVAGDVFSFRQTNGPFNGELTVSGDEMTGEVLVDFPTSSSWSFQVVRTITLRRVNSASRPSSQER